MITFHTEEEWTQFLMLISHHLVPPVYFSYPLGGQGDIKGIADHISKPKGSLGWTVADISPLLGFKLQQRPSGHDTQLFYRALKQHFPAGIIKEEIFYFFSNGSCWSTLWNPLWEALKCTFKINSNGVRLGVWSGRKMWGMENLQTKGSNSRSIEKACQQD